MLENIKKVIQYREMLIVLVQKELKTRYKGSVLGFVWNILNPLLMMMVYVVVFRFINRGAGVQHYSIFLLCGLLPWTWHANALFSGTTSITLNANLINKIYFPSEILPLVMVFANLIHFLFGMGLFLILVPFFGFTWHWGLLWILLFCVIQCLMLSGFVFILAPLHVFYRDVQNILNVFIPMWFFMTPIFYPFDMVPDRLIVLKTVLLPVRTIFLYTNPMIVLVQDYQKVIYDGSSQIPLVSTGILFGVSVIIFWVGYSVYNLLRSRLPEEV